MRFPYLAGLACALMLMAGRVAHGEDKPALYAPRVAAASSEGERAIAGYKIPGGLRLRLFAAEPLVANPVAFSFDEQGRLYVAETFRQKNAVIDNRDHMYWLDDDLAAMTVADRRAYHQRHLKEKLEAFTKEHDRIRRLEDKDGDGKADESVIFTDGYNDAMEGTGAGVLVRQGTVWYTNIPHLWKLRDTTGDGQADEKVSLHEGYGVRVAFRGHDLHGLRIGPDGRLYFSIGDRGFNLETAKRKFVFPDQGAVFRCELDGSNLEIVHRGLRNPQELAFDQFGNLFTVDNNSDSGDRARAIWVVEGGDSGWRMNFQYLSDRGPWNREKMWHPAWEGQPAFLVPPLLNFADGPSGLTYYPGTGLPAKYNDHFFLCDFRGGAANSGIRSFQMKPKDASFELVDAEEFAWKILATDVDFGPDSAMYISDWVNGWDGEGKGRIYKLDDPKQSAAPAVVSTKKLISEGFAKRPQPELIGLLSHANQMVRQEAQFALADLGAASIPALIKVAQTVPADNAMEHRLARVHAVWALGQICRRSPERIREAFESIAGLIKDNDVELQTVVARTLGEAPDAAWFGPLAEAVQSGSPRVRFHAAISLGKVAKATAVPVLVELLRENADKDPYLRHAAVTGLAIACNQQPNSLVQPKFDTTPLRPFSADRTAAVRLGVLLALERCESSELSAFLGDVEPRVVDAAARAIDTGSDAPSLIQLAALAERGGLSEPTLWRVINANFRLGGADHAQVVARLAARSDIPEALRQEALRALADWTKPTGRDRVTGCWRPLPAREAGLAQTAMRSALGGIFAGPDSVRRLAAEVAGKLEIKEVGPVLLDLMKNSQQPAETRAQALQALAVLKDASLGGAVELALKSDTPRLRAAGRTALAGIRPGAALESLRGVLLSGDPLEQQQAFATVAGIKDPAADALLAQSLEKLVAGELAPALHLDLLEAAARNEAEPVKALLAKYEGARSKDDPLASYRETLQGGDATRGRAVFYEKAAVSCVRCHKVAGQGGDVGPDLSSLGGQQPRDYLLTAIVDPNKQIAKGFETVIVELKNGKTLSGISRADDGQTLTLIAADGTLLQVDKSNIEDQARGKSAMPEDVVKKLSKSELRDLVEYLAQQKAPVPAAK